MSLNQKIIFLKMQNQNQIKAEIVNKDNYGIFYVKKKLLRKRFVINFIVVNEG